MNKSGGKCCVCQISAYCPVTCLRVKYSKIAHLVHTLGLQKVVRGHSGCDLQVTLDLHQVTDFQYC